jgi:hypothetical protein
MNVILVKAGNSELHQSLAVSRLRAVIVLRAPIRWDSAKRCFFPFGIMILAPLPIQRRCLPGGRAMKDGAPGDGRDNDRAGAGENELRPPTRAAVTGTDGSCYKLFGWNDEPPTLRRAPVAARAPSRGLDLTKCFERLFRPALAALTGWQVILSTLRAV